MKRNILNWRTQILESERRVAVPIMTHPGIDAIGATVRQAACDGEVHARAVEHLANTYPTAAASMIMDLSVEAEAFGCPTHTVENDVPSIEGPIVHDATSIDALAVPTLTAGRLPAYLQAARLAAQLVTDRPVLAGCIGPYSLAGRLFGMTEIMMGVLDDPQTLHALLDKCTRFLVAYLQAFRDAGVDGVLMAEPAAGMLSPELCDEFSSAYVARIVAAVQDESFALVLHNCGNAGDLNRSMASTGAWGYHLGNNNDIARSIADFPADALVMGNIDPAGTMKMGTPAQVRSQVLDLLRATADRRNFILSTGCDIPPHTPEANIRALFAALDEYNQA